MLNKNPHSDRTFDGNVRERMHEGGMTWPPIQISKE